MYSFVEKHSYNPEFIDMYAGVESLFFCLICVCIYVHYVYELFVCKIEQNEISSCFDIISILISTP